MSQATAAASPLYAHTEALAAAAAAASVSSSTSGHGTSGGTGHGTSSSSISSSTSTLSGLTASSLVTAAMGKQNMIYDNYGSTNNPSQSSAKPRSLVRFRFRISEFHIIRIPYNPNSGYPKSGYKI